MKKLFTLIVIAIAALALWYWKKSPSPAPQADSTATTVGAGFHPDASNATFDFDGTEVTLKSGRGETADESVGLTTETELLDESAYGDLNGDGKPDAVLLLTQSGGGSGTFVYVAAYVSGPVGYKGTNAVFLGDRIAPQSVSVSGNVATLKYLDRKDGEPFTADPTVSVTKQFVYQNGEFQER